MSIIKKVSVCLARVPLDEPVQFSTRTVYAREYCLVKITSETGVEGIGYCYAVNSSGRLLQQAVADVFAPLLTGQESTQVERLWREMYQDALLVGRAGALLRALSAVDIAIWDLNSQEASLPLYAYLGSNVSGDRVPAYASGGYYKDGKTNEDLAAELAGYVDQGYDSVKIKVGKGRASEEEARVRSAREAIGDDINLMLDANNAWSDLPTALEYMSRFEKYNPYWIEEPFSPDDITNHARLAAATRVPVATGEIEAGRWRFKSLIEQKAVDILQSDATVCGGITEWKRISAYAACEGITVTPHAWHDVHVHLVASTPNATWVEFMPDDHIVNFRRLIDRQLSFENGQLILPVDPGLGFEFDETAVSRYGVTHAGETGHWIEKTVD